MPGRLQGCWDAGPACRHWNAFVGKRVGHEIHQGSAFLTDHIFPADLAVMPPFWINGHINRRADTLRTP
jgi:hypothetical protein